MGAVERHRRGRAGWSGPRLRGGAAGRNADRDLDAVCALFETAARAEERTGGRGALNFLEELEAQDIAADTLTGARRAPRRRAADDRAPLQGPGVAARRGRRRAGGPLARPAPPRLAAGGRPDRPGRPRRAADARARCSPRSAGCSTSPPPAPATGWSSPRSRPRPTTATSRPASCAELGVRAARDVTRPPAPPAGGRRAGRRAAGHHRRPRRARRRCARPRPAGSPGSPRSTDDDGHAAGPVGAPGPLVGPVRADRSRGPAARPRTSPSRCPAARWTSSPTPARCSGSSAARCKADAPATAAQGFGNVVHVLADEVASGRTPADLDVLMERLDSVWDALAFDAPWKSQQEKEQARAALERFLRWHVMERGRDHRSPPSTASTSTLEAGGVRRCGSAAPWTGSSRTPTGRAYVVDFKTGKQTPHRRGRRRPPAARRLPAGRPRGRGRRGLRRAPPRAGGAELVQLRQGAAKKDGGDALPKVQAAGAAGRGELGRATCSPTAAGRVLDERFTPTHRAALRALRLPGRSAASAQPEGRAASCE